MMGEGFVPSSVYGGEHLLRLFGKYVNFIINIAHPQYGQFTIILTHVFSGEGY
jgi:hypothetical protein